MRDWLAARIAHAVFQARVIPILARQISCCCVLVSALWDPDRGAGRIDARAGLHHVMLVHNCPDVRVVLRRLASLLFTRETSRRKLLVISPKILLSI